MVLLTSSTISVAISSGVIFTFTSLLFLSGYVLQQQTVRSLQAALHPPPAPSPTLPTYFQQNYTEGEEVGLVGKEFGSPPGSRGHQSYEQGILSPSEISDVEEYPANTEVDDGANESGREKTMVQSGKKQRLAYVQILTTPPQICSVLLFIKSLTIQQSIIEETVIVYPQSWESDTASDATATALALMRIARDEYNITLSPMPISAEENRYDDLRERALLSALPSLRQNTHLLYLRTPGLLLNAPALDSALVASTTVANGWTPPSPAFTSALAILMIVPESETPTRIPVQTQLVAEASTIHENHHQGEMDVEALARTAAYIHFEEAELEHRRKEKEWYGGVFERFERERGEVCKGLDFGEVKGELRRRKY